MPTPQPRALSGEGGSRFGPLQQDGQASNAPSISETTISPDIEPSSQNSAKPIEPTLTNVDKQGGRQNRAVVSGGEKKGEEFLVKWEGEDDEDDPLNTPLWRKWFVFPPVSSWPFPPSPVYLPAFQLLISQFLLALLPPLPPPLLYLHLRLPSPALSLTRLETDSMYVYRAMTTVLSLSCACVTCCSSMASSTYSGMEREFGVSQEICILSISLFVAGLGTGPRTSFLYVSLER